MINVKPAGQPIVRTWQKLERSDFLVHNKYVQCQTLHGGIVIELYPSIPLSVILTVFQGHDSVKQL